MGIIIDLTARQQTAHDTSHERDHHRLWKLPVHQGTHFDLQRHHRSPDWRHGGDLDPLVDNNNEYIHLELFAQVQANTTDVLDRMPLYWLCYRHNNQISVVIEPGASLIHAGRSRSFLIAFT